MDTLYYTSLTLNVYFSPMFVHDSLICSSCSSPVSGTDPDKGSKDTASLLVCTRKKNFCLGIADFLWVTS